MSETANGGLSWRMNEIERRVANIEENTRKLDVIDQRVKHLAEREFKTLEEDVKALRRSFYTFAFSVVAGSIIFAFSALQLT